jgi:hypothetical protein
MEFPHSITNGLLIYDVLEDTDIIQMRTRVEPASINSYLRPNKVAPFVLAPNGVIHEGFAYHTEIPSLAMHAKATALAHTTIPGEKETIAITDPS